MNKSQNSSAFLKKQEKKGSNLSKKTTTTAVIRSKKINNRTKEVFLVLVSNKNPIKAISKQTTPVDVTDNKIATISKKIANPFLRLDLKGL